MKQRTFDLPEAMLERLKIQAARDGISQGEVMRQALSAWFASHGTPYAQPTSPAPCTPTSPHVVTSPAPCGDDGKADPSCQPTSPQVGGDAALARVRGEDSSCISSPSPYNPEKKNKDICAAAPPDSLFPEAESPRAVRDRQREEEIRWRIERTWEAHLKAWRKYLRRANGTDPTQRPTLHPDDIVKPIRLGLLAHDRHLLGADQREAWEHESKVRAAGIGIFYDTWCNGTHRDNDASAGGKKYLEHWRPWKRLHGKPDPIPKFAEIYFELRDANDATARMETARG